MDNPDIRAVLRIIENRHLLKINLEEATFFLNRDTVVPPPKASGMNKWRDTFFRIMAQNADRAASYYNLPPENVFEIGTQIKLWTIVLLFSRRSLSAGKSLLHHNVSTLLTTPETTHEKSTYILSCKCMK